MILVDSNMFMYAAGREHPLKKRAAAFLERVARGSVDAAIDADVLQEILHRYRWVEGRLVYDTARMVFPEVLPVTAEVTDRARRLLDGLSGLTARDAVHAAVVQVYGLDSIASFDRDFDQMKGLRRIEP